MKRMYILVLDTIPLGLAMAAVGHAAVACTLKYLNTDEVSEWLETSFRKIVCKVNAHDFEMATMNEPDFVLMTELSLNDKITAVAFKPREKYHKCFKFFRLYK